MKNILITGGAGFIGSNLSCKLLDLGYNVTALDNLSPQIHGKNYQNSPQFSSLTSDINFIKGDVTIRKDLEKAIKNQDVIIHLAAETGTGQSMYEIEKYNHVNVYGTALLMDVLVNTKNSVQKVVLASSRAVYGEGKYVDANSKIVYPSVRLDSALKEGRFNITSLNGEKLTPLPTDENSTLHPVSYYGVTKLQQEQTVAHICKSIGMDYVILRYQNVYGVGQSLINPYTGILSIFSSLILDDKSLNIFEDGLPMRDFINIQDTVEATIIAMKSESAKNETINIGSGEAISVLEVAKTLTEKYHKMTEIVISRDYRIGDIRYNVADLTKMKNLLQFHSKVSFAQGITEFADWVVSQPHQQNNYIKSLEEMQQKGFFKS